MESTAHIPKINTKKTAKEEIFITRPSLPPLDEFVEYLRDIWQTRSLTNMGKFHNMFEDALCEYLGVKYCSLFCNGTVALTAAIKALGISGEVITTPFSFVATTHALAWSGCTPVFCDIEPGTLNLDPDKVEQGISQATKAILPVHIYGNPCKISRFEDIAAKRDLRLIFDAAHAFGVRHNGRSVFDCDAVSMVSFHATKIFNTIEGAALVLPDKKIKEKVDVLKNFGFRDEVTVESVGINGKMNEVQSAYGLVQLRYIDEHIERCGILAGLYRRLLSGTRGITCMDEMQAVEPNHSYFPILIDEDEYLISRDGLYNALKQRGIYTRRYFYPLISQFPDYLSLPSANPGNLPVATKTAKEILCLPIYPSLREDQVETIVSVITQAGKPPR